MLYEKGNKNTCVLKLINFNYQRNSARNRLCFVMGMGWTEKCIEYSKNVHFVWKEQERKEFCIIMSGRMSKPQCISGRSRLVLHSQRRHKRGEDPRVVVRGPERYKRSVGLCCNVGVE